jgi:hypothetical protein
VSDKARQRAAANRRIREQQGIAGDAAQIAVTVEYEDMPGMAVRVWGVDEHGIGPKRNPEHDRRDYVAARVFRSARALRWPYGAAIRLARAAAQGIGRRWSEATIAAAIRNPSLPNDMPLLDGEEIEALARMHSINNL